MIIFSSALFDIIYAKLWVISKEIEVKIFITKHIKVFFFKKLRGNGGKITMMYLGIIIFSFIFLIVMSISTRKCCSLLTHIDDNKFIINIIKYLFDNFETFSSYLNAYFNAEN